MIYKNFQLWQITAAQHHRTIEVSIPLVKLQINRKNCKILLSSQKELQN